MPSIHKVFKNMCASFIAYPLSYSNTLPDWYNAYLKYRDSDPTDRADSVHARFPNHRAYRRGRYPRAELPKDNQDIHPRRFANQ